VNEIRAALAGTGFVVVWCRRDPAADDLAGMSLNTYQETRILNEITQTYQFPTNLFVGDGPRLNMLEERLKIRRPGGIAAAPSRPRIKDRRMAIDPAGAKLQMTNSQ